MQAPEAVAALEPEPEAIELGVPALAAVVAMELAKVDMDILAELDADELLEEPSFSTMNCCDCARIPVFWESVLMKSIW